MINYCTKDIDLDDNIKAKEILARISALELFKYYCNKDFVIGKPFKSPLREDNNPSFAVYDGPNGLVFKDFGSGDTGNIFTLVSTLHGLSYRDALRRIRSDFSITSGGSALKQVQLIRSNLNYIKKVTTIKIKRRPWNNDLDADYWRMQHRILQGTLDFFQVIPISHYWLNEGLTRVVLDHNPAYAYRLTRGIYKILFPYEERSRKWLANSSKDYYQGFKQLPKTGDLLVITKAMKDVMCLYQIGIPAIAPNSEGQHIPESLVLSLLGRFKRLVLWYDNDKAGKHAIQRLRAISEAYNIQTVEVPEESGCKDIAEFQAEYGITDLIKLVKSMKLT